MTRVGSSAICSVDDHRSRDMNFLADCRTGLLAISFQCSIAADSRRLFNALTEPEYIESWISLPCAHLECRNKAYTSERHFAIEHFCSNGGTTSFRGTYLAFRRHKLLFSWQADEDNFTPNSIVAIRLQGDFGRTTLSLTHTGFNHEEQLRWHHLLWLRSLERLTLLFERQSTASTSRY